MMPNNCRRCISVLYLLYLPTINIDGWGIQCYNVGGDGPHIQRSSMHIGRYSKNHKYGIMKYIEQTPEKQRHSYGQTIRRSTSLCLTIESMDFMNDLVQFGAAEEIVPIAAGIATTVALLLMIPPSRLISTGDLNTVVTGTYLEQKKNQLRCVYKASKDGWSAIAFHDAVDDKGSGIVVARTITGTIFGGYNPNGWRSTDDYYSSSAAFLWCFGGNGKEKVVKLPILPGGNCAVFDYATSGPCFGAADLIIGPPQAAIMGGFAGPDAEDISKSAGSLRQCKSSVGATYDYDRAWPIRGNVRLSEVEVYCLSNIK